MPIHWSPGTHGLANASILWQPCGGLQIIHRLKRHINEKQTRPYVHSTTPKCSCSRCKACIFVFKTSSINFPRDHLKLWNNLHASPVIYGFVCKRYNKTYVGEIGRKLAERFREHLIDFYIEVVSLQFKSPDQQGETDISVTALRSCYVTDHTSQHRESPYP